MSMDFEELVVKRRRIKKRIEHLQRNDQSVNFTACFFQSKEHKDRNRGSSEVKIPEDSPVLEKARAAFIEHFQFELSRINKQVRDLEDRE